MGISSTGSGRPSPLGPVPVQPRTTCQGQPGAACPLGGRLRSCPWGAAPRCPPGPGRGRGAVLRTLRVVQALTRPRGAAPRCPACPAGVPISPEKWGERGPGPSVIGRQFRWNHCRVDPATWVPRRLRRGSPAFFRRKPEERTPGASPWTPGFMAARSHSLVFGIVVSDTIEGLFLSGF